MASTDARPVPRKNVAFRLSFAIRKPSDSTLITTWAGQDSEVSKDSAAFADCTNEATEVGTTGCGYLDLTSTEMNCDCLIVKITVTNTGSVPLVFVIYPEEVGDYRSDTAQIDGSSAAATALKDFANLGYNSTLHTVNIDSGNYLPQVTRDLADTQKITFNWPSPSATIAVRRSFNGAAFAAADGAVTYLRDDDGTYVYQLAYDADDRLTTAGLVTYEFDDGVDILYQPLLMTGVPAGGAGARTVTITVTDESAVELEGATVRLTKAAESYVQTTDVDGNVVFNVDDGTWTVAITLPAYNFAGASLVVNGTETQTYEMTAVAITPSAPDQTTGFCYCYDINGVPEEDVPITLTFRAVASGDRGAAYNTDPRTVLSDVDGLVEFPGLFKGASYFHQRGSERANKKIVDIPLGAGATYDLDSTLGHE